MNLEYLAGVRAARRVERQAGRLPRHAGRHRLAHDDDQRARRAGLGRRRHRGRGRDARPAARHARPAGRRLPAARRAARGRDRDRPGAHRDAAAAQEGRRRQVRRVLRRRPVGPVAGRSRDDREHGARVRRDDAASSRSTTRRCATCAPPAAARQADRTEALLPGAGPVPRRRRRAAGVQRHARARPGRRRAVAGRPQAPAGSRRAVGHEEDLPRRADRAGEGARLRADRRRAGEDRHVARLRLDPGAGPRRGRHRRDHLVHEHLEPVGDDGGGPGREEGAGEGPRREAVGEDEPRARLEGGDRLPDEGRRHGRPVGAGLRRRGLRLHDLHRQLGPAARGDGEGRRRVGHRGRRRALGQPQLRGPRPSARRAPTTWPRRRWSSPTRWRGRSTSTSRPSRWARAATARRSTSRTSGRPRARSRRRSTRRSIRAASRARYGNVFDGNPDWNAIPVAGGDVVRVERRLDLHAEAAVLPRADEGAGAGRPTSRAARAGHGRRLGHDRPHLAGRQHRRRQPGGALPRGARRRRRRTSTRTARGAATTR